MHFTEKERDWTRKLLAGGITTVAEFVTQCLPLKAHTNTAGNFAMPNNLPIVKHGSSVSLIQGTEMSYCTEINSFISLINRLSNLGLVTRIPAQNRDPLPVLFTDANQKPRPAQRIYEILISTREYVFHVNTAPLEQFVANEFRTDAEVQYAAEQKARESAQRTTLAIAIASIIVSLLISIATAVFNYYIFTNERRVFIENPISIPSPLPVVLVETNAPGCSVQTQKPGESKHPQDPN
ncbi:MAG: hypothetical protein HZA91_20120 [Verrucomicrobia bacterium]|nr:hypothetical protein [Verrucomicrobiota bacterium]